MTVTPPEENEVAPALRQQPGAWPSTQEVPDMTNRSDEYVSRFLQKIEVGEGGCWEWQGATTWGYAVFTAAGRRTVRGHRWIYEQLVAPIPDGLVLDHLCRNTRCVNPDHLEPVTQRENIMRGVSPSALHAGKTHCVHGHEFTPENTYFKRLGRECRTCRRIHKAEWKVRNA